MGVIRPAKQLAGTRKVTRLIVSSLRIPICEECLFLNREYGAETLFTNFYNYGLIFPFVKLLLIFYLQVFCLLFIILPSSLFCRGNFCSPVCLQRRFSISSGSIFFGRGQAVCYMSISTGRVFQASNRFYLLSLLQIVATMYGPWICILTSRTAPIKHYGWKPQVSCL